MQKITIIAAIGQNHELGHENNLLWDLPIDMKHFLERTSKKPVIMGRRTFNSIGKPLPNRRNIIISRSFIEHENIELVHSIKESLEITKNEPEIMIIGGAEIYTQFLPYATNLSITRVDEEFAHADAFFPKWSENEFILLSEKKYMADDRHVFGFTIQEWERK